MANLPLHQDTTSEERFSSILTLAPEAYSPESYGVGAGYIPASSLLLSPWPPNAHRRSPHSIAHPSASRKGTPRIRSPRDWRARQKAPRFRAARTKKLHFWLDQFSGEAPSQLIGEHENEAVRSVKAEADLSQTLRVDTAWTKPLKKAQF
jgi:hypothetical protein